VASGIQKTWNVLAQTRNRAAVPVLAAALETRCAEIHAGAVRALARRRDPASHEPLIRHFATFGEAEQEVLREAIREMPRRMSAALTQAVLEGDAKLCENACNIILLCRDYEMFPVLIKAAEERRHRHSVQATAALFRLTNLLYQDVTEKRSGADRPPRDPYFVRRQVLTLLARSLARYHEHQQQEIVEAFLVLAPADNATLLTILRDKGHLCHQHVLTSLKTSKVPGMMRRLVEFLQNAKTPARALDIVAGRTDRRFLELLLGEFEHPLPLRVLHNMRRLQSIAWLENDREVLLDLGGPAQAVAVELAVVSRISRQAVFALLTMFLQHGAAEGRRASCRALADFRRPQATALIMAAARDHDAAVREEAVRQLRGRQPSDALGDLATVFDFQAAEERLGDGARQADRETRRQKDTSPDRSLSLSPRSRSQEPNATGDSA